MSRIMAIDYGGKKTGIAVSDPLQIIATGLDTVATKDLMGFIKTYFLAEEVSAVVIGEPLHEDGNPTALAQKVYKLADKLRELYPQITVELQDERYTSREAKRIILQSGVSKKKRRDKTLVDKVSAILILQEFMEKRRAL